MEAINNQATTKEIQIPDSQHGKRIDSVLSDLIPSLTRVQIKKLISENRITINGKVLKPSKPVKGGELVNIEIPPPSLLEIEPENIELDYIYEDEDIIVLNKQAGISVHPGAGIQNGTLVNALLFKSTDLSGIGGKIRPGIVHRLDKDTTGIMVIAKNDLSHINLSDQFKKREVIKIYHALVLGRMKEDYGIISIPVGRHKTDRKKMSSQTNKPRHSSTEWKVIKRFNIATYVEVLPLTGRTHQIRVHFSESGYPLLGDKIYGRKKYPDTVTSRISRILNRQALHAYSMNFKHPRTGKSLTFKAPLPRDFTEALILLEKK